MDLLKHFVGNMFADKLFIAGLPVAENVFRKLNQKDCCFPHEIACGKNQSAGRCETTAHQHAS